ncbi:SGNH/GDSL hydrolase family protein [Prevotella cerevisiae]|jgi:lysophospholipase L1-like esterase|uniref:SGNH/GDSL hydrolase family protein n=1 Tax=Segatella cerevisiae TaxID=2053716 RepID=A0ABT1BTY7_9BACT|nr:SGNH/GDSL hydrolase family protein [Segatella cerevisiae]MCH3994396.1 SGNH/GDSL hydrolase family protein [Prevotella sp.]MCO6024552.1 SGNH/GDSL hydrolase family protein [Segatella cerevisiae]
MRQIETITLQIIQAIKIYMFIFAAVKFGNIMKRKIAVLLTLLSIWINTFAQALSWTGTFAAAMEFTEQGDMPQVTSLANISLREIVPISLGGQRLQIQFSNEWSQQPVEIKCVYIANILDSNAIDTHTVKWLNFNGCRSITIPAGKAVYSDDFNYQLKPLQRLAVTICYGSRVPVHATSHRGSRTTSYIAKGTVSPKEPFITIDKPEHWYNLAKINILSKSSAIAILGNSITDGRGSTTNRQNRWTDFFAKALQGKIGVLNLGIGGNCVLSGGISEPAIKRFDRDILEQKGVKALIIFEGTNDIGCSKGNPEEIAQNLIQAYRTLIKKAHEKGIRVYGATITPFKGNNWYSQVHEVARETVNNWIRNSGVFDRLIDFDKLVRDPNEPDRIRTEYSFDWLHLNPKGYEVMGQFAATIIQKDNLSI